MKLTADVEFKEIQRFRKDVEMKEADRWCGMAGSFNLKFYELSRKIADRKIKNVIDTEADIVSIGCPGCEIHFSDTIARHRLFDMNLDWSHVN